MEKKDLQQFFLEVYERYSEPIFRHCYFRMGNRERAKELMQETFMKTWLKLSEGKEIENLGAYIYRIAKNMMVDEIRKKKEMSLEALMEDGFQPGVDETEIMKKKIDLKETVSAIQKLEEQYREILTLRYVDDLTIPEIAKMINISENLASVRINRALKKLQQYIKPSQDEND